LIISWLVLLGLTGSHAQNANISRLFTTNEEKGDDMFTNLYYEQAIDYYLLAMKRNEDDRNLRLKVARSYRMLHDFDDAVLWYDSAFSQSFPVDQNELYHYAESLLSAGKYAKAVEWYEEYLAQAESDRNVPQKIEAIENLRFFLRDSILYSAKNLFINTEDNEFGAQYYDEGIVFLSSGVRDPFIDHDVHREDNLFDLFYAPASKNFHGEPEPFSKKINSKYHEGTAAFFHGEDRMIFTRNNYQGKSASVSPDGLTKLQLYFAEKTEGEWGSITPFEHNNLAYNLAQPGLSNTDDTLFFASDMPGGYGGIDIYMSTKQGNKWSKPKNLGPVINSEGDDAYPFMQDNFLFFSSNGYGGMGGFDIYRSPIIDGQFTAPVNMSYPINTNKDDYAYVFDKESLTGYFTSNRPGGKGKDDLYKVTKNGLMQSGIVRDIDDYTAIEDVQLTLLDSEKQNKGVTLSGAYGFFFYLPYDATFEVVGKKEGYTMAQSALITTFNYPLHLDSAIVWMWKHKLFAEGKIYSNELQSLMSDVLVTIENLTDGTRDSVRTGEDGKYRFTIRPDKQYRITATKDKHIPNGFDLNTAGMEEDVLVNDIVLEEEYIDKDIIYFDYDKSVVQSKYYQSLNNIIAVLKKYPDAWLVLGAHADSRGTHDYNQGLAERRASSTIKYLTARGIKRSRINDHAFGEELLLNQCSDGVECDEEDHSKNRRCELKIERESVNAAQ